MAAVAPGWRLDARDLALLEAACRAQDHVVDLEAAVERDGLMLAGSKGQMVLHPAIGETRMQRQLIAGLLKQIELRPPREPTGKLNRRQRAARMDELAQARRKRAGGSDG